MISLTRWGSAALVAFAMAGCGGDGGGDAPVTPPTASVKEQISAAAAVPANDTASNSSSAFTVVQGAGVTAVTVPASASPTTAASLTKVNFSVFSDGKVVSNLATSNVSFAIAKLVPGTNGNPDQWVNYIYRTESTSTAPNNVGNGPNSTPAMATATQATTDAKMSTTTLASLGLASQLVYNADGYYSYVFATDIRDPKKTNGVVFEPDRTHRVVIQLSYKNAAGETVLVNPYIDFTVDAAGKSVFVTDPSKTRKMADVTSCNGCHDKLALHGGGRVDTQYCVMCHNPGTVDANSGNNLNMATMIHKIHAGKLLANPATLGGEDYVIWGYNASKHDYAEVGFPQDLRNCAKCHTASNPNTPQGDNWKTKVSKEACLTCHASKPGSAWNTAHTTYVGGGNPLAMTNAQCVACHNPTSNPTLSPERVHWNQNEENAAKYKMNIEDVTYTQSATPNGTSTVTVKYFVSDPTNSNKAYDLTVSATGTACSGSGASISCNTTTTFGNLRFYLAYQNMAGQYQAVTEFSAYNNGGNSANAYAYKGTNDGTNHYTVAITIPANTTYTVAPFGTARVVSIGQIKEVKLQAKSAADPRPPVVPTTLINTVMQHTYKDVVLGNGSLQPRRVIVSNDKCNVCHGALGTTAGSNTPGMDNAFHSGARNTVESCVVCHDPNRSSSSNMMTNGLTLNGGLYEPYQFKRMIHGIHGNSKRLYPFTHANKVVGAFCNPANPLSKAPICDPNLVLASGVENYGAEVAYPQVGLNCDACHVNGSWKQDLGTLGSVVFKPTVVGGTATTSDPNAWLVISPKAATCTACHDSSNAIGHVTSFGGSAFGDKSQAQVGALPRETCNDCHSPGGFKSVDIVHGQK